MRGWKTASLALAGGAAAALIAGGAAHAGPFNLANELLGHHAAKPPPVGLYRDNADNDPAFVLDRSTVKPLLKFDDDLEIWALQPAPGPRGDVIYRNDVGDPMVRATRLGGMTVFTPKRPDGSAAAFEGASAPLRVPPLSPQALFRIFYQASIRA